MKILVTNENNGTREQWDEGMILPQPYSKTWLGIANREELLLLGLIKGRP
jgi:hypothetical protein